MTSSGRRWAICSCPRCRTFSPTSGRLLRGNGPGGAADLSHLAGHHRPGGAMARWCWATTSWGPMPPIRPGWRPTWGWCCCAITRWSCRAWRWCRARRPRPIWARDFLAFLMSARGPDAAGRAAAPARGQPGGVGRGQRGGDAGSAWASSCARCRSAPGVLVYLDQAKRRAAAAPVARGAGKRRIVRLCQLVDRLSC